MHGLTRCCTRTAVLITLFTAAVGCTDRITQPTRTTSPSVARHDTGCDPTTQFYDACNPTGGGPGTGTPDPPTYLTYFLVSNCNPSLPGGPCQLYCNGVAPNCIQQRVDGDRYEIRQLLYQGDGVTTVEYNQQIWHGNTGPLNVQVFTHNLCAYPGGFINVEVYHINFFGMLERNASFRVYAVDNGGIKNVGNGITWAAAIRYSWTC